MRSFATTRARRAPGRRPRRDPKGRYAFDCPACGSERKLRVVIFEDGRPPGYGRGGCASPSCPIPKNGDALEFVRAFLARGKASPITFDGALSAALHAARAQNGPVGETAVVDGTDAGAAGEPSGPFVSGSLVLPPDPLVDGRPAVAREAAAGPVPGAPPPALFDLSPEPATDTSPEGPAAAREGGGRPNGAKPRRAAERVQPELPAEAEEGKADLEARAAVYEGLLRLCPPDERLLEDLKALGVSEAIARRESFGAFYPARAQEVLASLQLSLGAARLLAAPGFDAPAGRGLGRGTVAFELEATGDDALYALVPYRDVKGRAIALEAISLSGTRGFGSHRLLGCPPDGRDPHLGGAHHVWYPGDPRRLQAITDDILEGMRAASAGVRCAATRGPESFDPGAGADAAPGLRGVTFGGARVLYAPSPSARARAAAPRAARVLISRHGGTALVLGTSFEETGGLGSYLLGCAPEERTRAFALLASEPNAVPLAPEEAASPTATAKATAGMPGGATSGPRRPRPSPFEAEARKAPAVPRKRRVPAPMDFLAGTCAAALVFLAAFVPVLALADPARDVLVGTASALEAASGGRRRRLVFPPGRAPPVDPLPRGPRARPLGGPRGVGNQGPVLRRGSRVRVPRGFPPGGRLRRPHRDPLPKPPLPQADQDDGRETQAMVTPHADHPNNTPEKRRARAAHAGRAPKIGQRGAQLQPRDTAAFMDLFFLDWMELDHLHLLHYSGAVRKRAANRLQKLVSDGHLKSVVLRSPKIVRTASGSEERRLVRRVFYALTAKTRDATAARLARQGLARSDLFANGFESPGRKNPEVAGLTDLSDWLANHQAAVADLYAWVRPLVEERLGPPGPHSWFWRNERRAYREYHKAGNHALGPDAELVVALTPPEDASPDERPEYAHLFVEVQTANSHKSSAEISRKVAGYARASGGASFPKRWALLFATETLAHEQAAVAACERFGVENHAAGSEKPIAELLVAYAKNPAALSPDS